MKDMERDMASSAMSKKPAKKAKASKKAAAKKPAKKAASKKSNLKQMAIRPGASGGFIASHDFHPGADGMAPPSVDHAIPDLDALHNHVDAHLGGEGMAGVE